MKLNARVCAKCQSPVRVMGLCVSHYNAARYQLQKQERLAAAKARYDAGVRSPAATKQAADARYRARHPERRKNKDAKRYVAQREKLCAAARAYQVGNRTKVAAAKKKYCADNKARVAAWAARRRAALKSAAPAWADAGKISSIYQQARTQAKHVDHDVPLQHDLVCGLHCEANLQLLSPAENRRKSNTRWADMP